MVSTREQYGQDIDGTRGVTRWSYELEDADRDEIKEKLLEEITSEYYDSTIDIELCCSITGNMVGFEIKISDYLSVAEFTEVADNSLTFEINGKSYYILSFEKLEIDIISEDGEYIGQKSVK